MNTTNLNPTPTTARLLFVDDEPNILKSLNRLFRSGEYQVFLAESGAEALQILAQQPIDLIISDMRMPHMDGAEFLTQAAERWPETVRILLTGYADLDSTINAVNNGKIHSYCSKPWVDHELKIIVNGAIEQKRLREERQQLFSIINQQNQQLKELNEHLEDRVHVRTEQLKLSLQRLDDTHTTLKKQFTRTVIAFAQIIEMRPGIKSGQSKFIAEHAKALAGRLKLDSAEKRDILYAGLLSQIGKMCLPDSILQQSLNQMSPTAKKRYLNHGQEGWRLLSGIEQLKSPAGLVLNQYEHYDGSGEPHGYSGAEIPLGSRILAVVRDYIAYIDGFITGSTMAPQDAQNRLLQKKGSSYDPFIVDQFIQLLTDAKAEDQRPIIEISWTQLQPGMEAAEIIYNQMLYLKDQVLTTEHIDKILEMRKQSKNLILRIRLAG